MECFIRQLFEVVLSSHQRKRLLNHPQLYLSWIGTYLTYKYTYVPVQIDVRHYVWIEAISIFPRTFQVLTLHVAICYMLNIKPFSTYPQCPSRKPIFFQSNRLHLIVIFEPRSQALVWSMYMCNAARGKPRCIATRSMFVSITIDANDRMDCFSRH